MKKFKTNANIVLDFMIENHYSEHSLHLYKKIFESMQEYLMTNELSYSPELGEELLHSGSDLPFGLKGKVLHTAVIQKINAVYATGVVSNVLVSSRKPYSALHLEEAFVKVLARFTESIQTSLSETQVENIRRRCCLFLKYLQSKGKANILAVSYEDISDYHFLELSHLKSISRLMEEGAICRFLRFLYQEKQIHHALDVVLFNTMIRTDELIKLDIGDVVIDSDIPFLKIQGKGGKERMAPLAEEAIPLIKTYLTEYHGSRPANNTPFIYTVQHGHVSRMSERNVERIVKKYADIIRDTHPDLPRNVYPHMLRRTHATGLYRDGVAVEAIASALGHASIQTTKDHYAFPSLVQKQQVVNAGGVVIAEPVSPEWPDDEEELARIWGLR